MGFAAEMDDFVKGWDAADRWRTNSTNRAYTRMRIEKDRSWNPNDPGPGMPGPGSMPAIPEEGQPDSTKPDSTKPDKTRDSSMPNVAGQDIGQYIYNYYRGKRVPHIAAASIAGNLMRESGGDPRVLSGARTGDAGASYYVGQWNGGRLDKLNAFAKGRSHPKPTLQDQLDFVLEEMNPKSQYVDADAAKMFPNLLAATDLAQGVRLFQMGFERPKYPEQDFAPRLKYAQAFGDSGDASTDPFSFDQTGGTADTGTKPSKQEDTSQPPPAEQAADSGGDQALSANLSFDLPEVAIPEITAQFIPPPQSDYLDTLAQQQQVAAGGPSPWMESQSRPTMRAASGGVIPEPVQSFQAGGAPVGQINVPNPVQNPANPSAVASVDRYSPTRYYTQPPPASEASTFTPHRVGYKPLPGPVATPAVSDSVAQLRTARSNRAAQEKAAADAKAAAAAKAAADKAAADAAAAAAARNRYRNQDQRWGYRTLGDTSGRGGHDSGGYSTSGVAGRDTGAGFSGQGKGWGGIGGFGAGLGKGGNTSATSKGGLYAEGGIIPEPGAASYAQGGVATVDPVYWKKLTKQYEQTSPRSGESARDRAAKQVTHGRSTAIRVGEGGPEAPRPGKAATKGGKKAAEKAGKKKAAVTKLPEKAPTPSPRPEPALRQAAGTPTEPYEPKPALRQAAGTPTQPYELRRAAGTPTLPYEPKPALRQPAGTPTQPYEPIPAPAAPSPISPAVAEPAAPAPAIPEPAAPDSVWTRPPGAGETAPVPPDFPVPPPAPPRTGPLIPTPDNPTPEFQQPLGAGETAQPAATVPTPEPPRPEQGPAAPPPDIYAAVRDARLILSRGGDPSAAAEVLRRARVPTYQWPQDVKEQILGFARGGAIPDPQQRHLSPRAEEANYTTSAPGAPSISSARPAAEPTPPPTAAAEPAAAPPSDAAAEPQKQRLQPTPELMNQVREATAGGARFIGRHFGIDTGQTGAIATPEDGARQQQGMQRFAQGEGAATPDEIKRIDDKIGMPANMAEGDKNMERMARMMNWYLSRGRKDDAEAAAASLMMYGAGRVGQLGSLAAVAYQKGDLDRTIKYLEKAYEMIPDGGSLDVTRSGNKLIAHHTDADGNDTRHEITAQELPGLIQSVQNKSVFWQQVSRLGDPEGAKFQQQQAAELAKEGRSAARESAKTAETRGYTEGREAFKHEQTQADELAKEKREADRKAAEGKTKSEEEIAKEARANAEADRRRLRDESLIRDRWGKDPTKQGTDWDTVSPLWSTARKAQDAMIGGKTPENQAALNEAASRLWDALPEKSRVDDMFKLGFDPSEYVYTAKEVPAAPGTAAPPAAAPAPPAVPGAVAAPAGGAQPPAGGATPPAGSPQPKKYPDGKWYIPDPARPGKFLQTTPPAGQQ